MNCYDSCHFRSPPVYNLELANNVIDILTCFCYARKHMFANKVVERWKVKYVYICISQVRETNTSDALPVKHRQHTNAFCGALAETALAPQLERVLAAECWQAVTAKRTGPTGSCKITPTTGCDNNRNDNYRIRSWRSDAINYYIIYCQIADLKLLTEN